MNAIFVSSLKSALTSQLPVATNLVSSLRAAAMLFWNDRRLNFKVGTKCDNFDEKNPITYQVQYVLDCNAAECEIAPP